MIQRIIFFVVVIKYFFIKLKYYLSGSTAFSIFFQFPVSLQVKSFIQGFVFHLTSKNS